MLMGRVARMYYEHGLTHQEIANTLGLSRIRVTRLLAEARASGLVEITVHVDEPLFADEERDLVERFGLSRAWISPSIPDAEKADRAFGVVGAEALSTVLEEHETVGLGLSTAVALMASAMPKSTQGGTFVPLSGSSGGRSSTSNPHELALRLAAATGGRAFHLPAPLLAASAEGARLNYADPSVSDVLHLAAKATLLVAGVGSMARSEGILLSSLPEDVREDLIARGAVGDMVGRFFDQLGQAVTSPLDERVVGLRVDQMKAIPRRLTVAKGASKVEPLNAAITGGLINMVVTDLDTARLMLNS